MAQLTIGEIGKVLQLNLTLVDQTVSPPIQKALDLTNVASVFLLYTISDVKGQQNTPTPRQMSIIGSPTLGVVQYAFALGDLVRPSNMGKNGVFRYSVQVNYTNGTVLYPTDDGKIAIKDDSVI